MYVAVQNEWPWIFGALYKTSVSLGLILLTSIIIFALNYRKMNISRFFQYKCIRNQIWPWRKKGQGQLRFIICANLVRPYPQCYIPSPKAIGLLVQEKKIFKEFLPYMGMVAILVM